MSRRERDAERDASCVADVTTSPLTTLDEPVRLLHALGAAGCSPFLDEDGQLFCSPPVRRVEWPDDLEEAFEAYYWELKALVSAESHRQAQRFTISLNDATTVPDVATKRTLTRIFFTDSFCKVPNERRHDDVRDADDDRPLHADCYCCRHVRCAVV
jgi:hypothetical protein